MQIIPGNIYDYPRYYDLVFGSDWRSEFLFLVDCFAAHATGKVQRLFEPACGTGRLIFRLAEAGFDVSGLDLNTRAVTYCNKRLKRHGLPETARVGDMRDFRLSRKADAAFNTINSFRHLQTARDAKQHLACMAESLRKGGVYIVGMHLTPTRGQPMEEESWSARRGHLAVNTHMWLLERKRRQRLEIYGMTFDIHTPTRSFRLADKIGFRTYTARQFRQLLEQVPQFEIAETYDFAYDLESPIDIGPETEDILFVLRKRSDAS